MPDKLREFIYLDDVSVNSHLSSLGKALPREVVEQSESGKETEGGADVKLAKGSRVWSESTGTETTRDATAPYRFEELRETLVEEDIQIHDNPDPRAVSRGDVIRVDGTTVPMSLYKIELAAMSFLEIFDGMMESDVIEDIDELADEDERDQNIDPQRTGDEDDIELSEALDDLRTILELAEEFIGDGIPIRVVNEARTYVTALDRSLMRVSGREAFFEETDYVIFGRVKGRINRDEEWDPIEATRVTGRYFQESEDVGDELRDVLRQLSEEMELEMSEEDLLVEGRSVEINPMAVYW
ncbi:DUF6414 family protein [Haloferax volcanii]|uniref:DUF6414 family protein n=1 Tax=Haloferax volcanii TaxID=2246 RepID=UPI003D3019C0